MSQEIGGLVRVCSYTIRNGCAGPIRVEANATVGGTGIDIYDVDSGVVATCGLLCCGTS